MENRVERVRVYRSKDNNTWIDYDAFKAEKALNKASAHKYQGKVFTTRKGYIEVTEPADSDVGWQQRTRKRVMVQFSDKVWHRIDGEDRGK